MTRSPGRMASTLDLVELEALKRVAFGDAELKLPHCVGHDLEEPRSQTSLPENRSLKLTLSKVKAM
jgi:hypothetical protein